MIANKLNDNIRKLFKNSADRMLIGQLNQCAVDLYKAAKACSGRTGSVQCAEH